MVYSDFVTKKPILVVSDNPVLAEFTVKCLQDEKLPFALFFTRNFRTGHAMRKIGAKKIDLDNQKILSEIVSRYELVISIHCTKIFPKEIFERIPSYNVHPGFNPHNRGWFPHVFSIINKHPAGVTIHKIDSVIDSGEIWKQVEVKIEMKDSSFNVYSKIIESEKELLKEFLKLIASGGSLKFAKLNKIGNYNSKEDYNKLCELDLMNRDTLKNHIDLLRALTHPPFKNAYFIDENNEKVYVEINFNN